MLTMSPSRSNTSKNHLKKVTESLSVKMEERVLNADKIRFRGRIMSMETMMTATWRMFT